MNLNLILSFLLLFSILLIGLFVLYGSNENKVKNAFFILCLLIITWILSNSFADIFNNDFSIIFIRLSIIAPLFIPIIFSNLINNLYIYNNKYNIISKYINKLSIVFIVIIVIVNQTNLNVKSIKIESWGISFTPGIIYYLLLIYLLITFSIPIIYMLLNKNILNDIQRAQTRSIIIGSILSISLSIIIDIILPLFNYSYFGIFSGIPTIFFIGFISYAITKHKLFNIKIIAIEIVIFGLWTFALLRTLLSENPYEFYTEFTILTISIILGVLLVRSMLNEIAQREKIEELTESLNNAYRNIEEFQFNFEEKMNTVENESEIEVLM